MKNKSPDSAKVRPVSAEKLHPRNPHRGRYDFRQLIAASPELAVFVSINPYGDESIDFADPAAVRALNRALLIQYYDIQGWDIPAHYLCPPIPGRADYLHYLADLLAEGGVVPSGVRVLDIGTGANCIYPLVGQRTFGWQFVGSDIEPAALANAQRILDANPDLSGAIELRLQRSPQSIFNGVVKPGEIFDLTLCNPPFHASLAEANLGTGRKWKNLGKGASRALNFGGQGAELWCRGGEEAFVCRMIAESAQVNCLWHSSLISKSSSLPGVYRALNNAGVQEVRTIEMAQGQKKSRFVAWTFYEASVRRDWCVKGALGK
ncbi:23S rRNA (adenine(1618)-N(6))-methyltransferase RlmF [Gallionella capsiferriformans]|uniref:Ribosomal RNA large subunit methyltransferase F n=1 Tax=Gallionella capsiferriformans (strain ES-2) TaxID=395494 RepID=D9SIJ9_GALCS|nr:23S rRNA (adenine(1618)-N(6))-methyltransferase RlmF [Gallionella capsiferriformans]ADL56162.1 rRNA (adenine-N(6)-)-methyltransferase [Gallionella capsiferriformans ES-2]